MVGFSLHHSIQQIENIRNIMLAWKQFLKPKILFFSIFGPLIFIWNKCLFMVIWIYLRLFIQEADELLQFQKSILLIQTKSSITSIYSTVCVILSTYPKKVLYENHPKEWKNKKKHYFHKIQLFEYRSQKVTSYNHEVIILFFPICEKFHNSEYIQFIEPNIILKTR